MRLAIGVDVGGTHTRAGLVAADGRLLDARKSGTPSGVGGARLLDWIAGVVRELAAARPETPPEAIGLAVPGPLNPQRTMILRAVNLPFLERVPLCDELTQRTGLAVVLDNDVAAGAWAEYHAATSHGGAETGPGRMVFLAIGTGIGAAVILDGKIVRHTRNTGGHLGHLVVEAAEDAPRCGCGSRGCLECFASGPALERAAQGAGMQPSLVELRARLQRGDAAAVEIVDRAARYLAVGLINVVHLYAPDEIVVGGGAAGALPELLDRARIHLDRLKSSLVPPGMTVRPARLGDDAGIIGAGLLALEPQT